MSSVLTLKQFANNLKTLGNVSLSTWQTICLPDEAILANQQNIERYTQLAQ